MTRPPTPKMAPPLPPLDECIKLLIDVSAAASVGDQATLISALVGYCAHLSQDQETLSNALRSGREMPFSSMPAMRELVTNPLLYQSVISLLSNDSGATGGSGPQNMTNVLRMHGRKRSPSEDATPNVSRKKPAASSLPSPMMPTNNKSIPQPCDSSSVQSLMSNVQVAAATILYSVFQHVDCWPVQIMESFAQDSFGHRNWVDDDRCKAFVMNLELSLKIREDDKRSDIRKSVAEKAEAHFSSLMSKSNKSPVSNATRLPSQSKELSLKEKRRLSNPAKCAETSSSSGEEEVLESEVISSSASATNHPQASATQLHNIFQSSLLPNKEPVRRRYHASSLDLANKVTSEAFEDRLNSKSKQNYRLLQTLVSNSFICIPRIRLLAAEHLERWLQSPALAGLARQILSAIVSELSCVEPSLSEDLTIIESILRLNLKANQLPMHIENITMIAKNVPTLKVAELIFTHCLQGECTSGSVSNALKPNDDHLRILRSAYAVLDKKLATTALASCVTTMMSSDQLENITSLLCTVVESLGTLHDGFLFVEAIIKYHSGTSKTKSSINAAARLIFECTILVTRAIPSLQSSQAAARKTARGQLLYSFGDIGEEKLNGFRKSMLTLRKKILRWCSTDFCRVHYKSVAGEERDNCSDTYYEQGCVTRGPGAPDFGSVLSGVERSDNSSSFLRMMKLIRCILLLSPEEIETSFSMTSEDGQVDQDRSKHVMFCCQYGADVDNEMMQIILSSPNMTPNTAVSLIESLIARCSDNKDSVITCDVDTAWKMYSLAEYTPVFHSTFAETDPSDTSSDEIDQSSRKRKGSQNNKPANGLKVPRLAITSMWWRINSVILVLSGLLPETLGRIMCSDKNPTIAALMRMTTSQKYRFPTADCSESDKDRIRQAEKQVKEKEATIAELLFMPIQEEQHDLKPTPQIASPPDPRQRGLRSSSRQREKKERQMAIEQERRAAALHAEKMRQRKALRALTKNIMLFDNDVERKPPSGCIDLLLAVNDSFGLAERFRVCTSPDFLLQAIGEGREAIERAYDWLIPIISSHPAIIDRLQPEASCFLLLRAYGREGDTNEELLDLTAPLLMHVTRSLQGVHGQHNARLAMDLLLQDIADASNGKRFAARKVLQQTLGDAEELDYLHLDCNCGWLKQMPLVENCVALVPLVIKYITQALAYETGDVLSAYISALSEYRRFLSKHGLGDDFDFVLTLCELIATRSRTCSDVFDRFSSLQELAVLEVKGAFQRAIESNSNTRLTVQGSTKKVTISIAEGKSFDVTSDMLRSAIILISNWQGETLKGRKENELSSSFSYLVHHLVMPQDSRRECEIAAISGLSSAKFKHNNARAVSVEEWVLLANARTGDVAKNAALTAPDIFLPRLLLCCGMPSSSFYTMLQRLDKMWESSVDAAKAYREMISPAAVSEWSLPGIGSQRVIKRKIYGRIVAYQRRHNGECAINLSGPFASWLLTAENGRSELASTGDASTAAATIISRTFDLNVEFEDLMGEEDYRDNITCIWQQNDSTKHERVAPNEAISRDYVVSCFDREQINVLEESLQTIAERQLTKVCRNSNTEKCSGNEAAKALLRSYETMCHNSIFAQTLLKWVPVLTRDGGENDLWQLIFYIGGRDVNWSHMKSLISECARKWSDEHISACQEWIISRHDELSNASIEQVLRFFVASSEQNPVDCFSEDTELNMPFTQECATCITKLALKAVDLNYGEDGPCTSRNSMPDWLVLVLVIGKFAPELVTRIVLDNADETTKHPSILSTVLLRLYLTTSGNMNLSDAKLRNMLLKASHDSLPVWLHWKCPKDNQLAEMLTNLTKSPHQRLVQSLTDVAKQHPLIFVRHLHIICRGLMGDGSGRDSNQQRLVKRGRIFGRHSSDVAIAHIGSKIVKVSINRWGYSFNEQIWTSVIDILMALPTTVAFTCGVKTGLTEILECYLKLFAVQIAELNAGNNIDRIRAKIITFLGSFRSCNMKDFYNWLDKDVSDQIIHGNVHQLLSLSGIDQFSIN